MSKRTHQLLAAATMPVAATTTTNEHRHHPAAAQDLGVTPTGAIVRANPRLRALVQHNKMSEVLDALDNGADVNEADGFHMSAAHYAAQNNLPELLQLLIDRGANVIDATNKYGRTPIYLAAGLGNMNCMKILEDAGAKREDAVSTENLESALMKAAVEGEDKAQLEQRLREVALLGMSGVLRFDSSFSRARVEF